MGKNWVELPDCKGQAGEIPLEFENGLAVNGSSATCKPRAANSDNDPIWVDNGRLPANKTNGTKNGSAAVNVSNSAIDSPARANRRNTSANASGSSNGTGAANGTANATSSNNATASSNSTGSDSGSNATASSNSTTPANATDSGESTQSNNATTPATPPASNSTPATNSTSETPPPQEALAQRTKV